MNKFENVFFYPSSRSNECHFFKLVELIHSEKVHGSHSMNFYKCTTEKNEVIMVQIHDGLEQHVFISPDDKLHQLIPRLIDDLCVTKNAIDAYMQNIIGQINANRIKQIDSPEKFLIDLKFKMVDLQRELRELVDFENFEKQLQAAIKEAGITTN